MRLDSYLVSMGYFSSRQRAKEAIKRGYILVNGNVVKKASKDVKGNEKISVLCEERPRGYWKLKEIDERFRLLREDFSVLDVGSSAGGFLAYCAERCSRVVGVEISEEFRKQLESVERKYRNVEVVFADAFRLELNEKFDLILLDLTLEPKDSFKALSRVSRFLKEGGRVLFVAKGVLLSDVSEAQEFVSSFDSRWKVLNVMTLDRSESYIYLE